MARKADYVMSLKGNHSSLHDDVALFAAEQKARNYLDSEVTVHTSVTKGHGRIETRKTTVIGATGWLQARHGWPGMKGVVVVESIRETTRAPDPEPGPEAADGVAPEGAARSSGTPDPSAQSAAAVSVAAPGPGNTAGKAK